MFVQSNLCTGTKSISRKHNGPMHQRQALPVHGAYDDAAGPRQPFLPAGVASDVPCYAGCTGHHAVQA